jgi:phospholipid/cholesterol/gamma-HCH transport system substrate-binding protein
VTNTTLAKTRSLAGELGPTLQALRPTARALGPTQRAVRPFLRESTPVIRDELRPFSRAALPTVRQLRPALRDLAAATPNLTRTFKSVNYLLNELAYNPPGDRDEGYLFWLSWANHLAPTVFATQDAHGPIRHGLVVFGCQTGALLDAVAGSNPQLGTLVDLLNGPNRTGVCPSSSQAPGGSGG